MSRQYRISTVVCQNKGVLDVVEKDALSLLAETGYKLAKRGDQLFEISRAIELARGDMAVTLEFEHRFARIWGSPRDPRLVCHQLLWTVCKETTGCC